MALNGLIIGAGSARAKPYELVVIRSETRSAKQSNMSNVRIQRGCILSPRRSARNTRIGIPHSALLDLGAYDILRLPGGI